MFRFGTPNMLYLLLLVPAMVCAFVLSVRARRRRLERFGQLDTLKSLIPDASPPRIRNKFILFICAVTLIIVALARPQFGSKLKESTAEGIEIMFVVDVSNSMLAQDFEPNRLERTKFAITRLLESLEDDRVGLVVFAGDAYVQLPLTTDYVAARNFIRQVSTNMVSRQGTAIGAAIDLASNSFSSQSEGSRVIILVSDGENHEDDAMAAAAAAAAQGIKIYAIGIGTPEGAPIYMGGDFLTDNEGNMVLTKLNEQMLSDIALSTGGAYILATQRSVGLNEIIEKINETEKSRFNVQVFDEYDEKYPYFIVAALVLLLLNSLMLSRKNRVLSRFNIFREKDVI
ncbi:MAG: VWA domain-containing protein [Alistipes sp.]|nr:VWA domain-containing protein [Alistipes sp.]